MVVYRCGIQRELATNKQGLFMDIINDQNVSPSWSVAHMTVHRVLCYAYGIALSHYVYVYTNCISNSVCVFTAVVYTC